MNCCDICFRSEIEVNIVVYESEEGLYFCDSCWDKEENKPSAQQQAEFNRGKYLPNGEEAK